MNTCTCHRQQNRTNTSPTKTRKIPPRTPDSTSDLNPHPKMPPIAVSKPTTDDNKPDLVQEAHGGDDQESVPEKMDDEEDEGRAPSRLAGGGQPDEDFEFGDQADPELAVLQ